MLHAGGETVGTKSEVILAPKRSGMTLNVQKREGYGVFRGGGGDADYYVKVVHN